MMKQCIICGASFCAPPSSKKITCSRECSARRKAMTHTGKSNTWSDASRKKQSVRLKAEGFTESARRGLSAAMANPESQRGERHREAKRWVLIAPDDERFEIVNLLDWARKHAEWFDVVQSDADRERIAHNIRSGFGQIVLSMKNQRKHPIYTYKGWRLGDWPQSKSQK